ncbi:MAG TPA: T9SS type A sorting domain-containing protein [Bacteroidia bacterium]|nr:T9SS type A sorting domain-containing protein [Bacteroidia bacterium]
MKLTTITATLSILFSTLQVSGQWNQSAFTTGGAAVDYPAANAAYMCGYQAVYKSTDGGISWNEVLNMGPFAQFTDVDFVNADTGFVSLYGWIHRTFDGGTTWTSVSGNAGERIKFTGEKLFCSYASNDTTYIIRSDDYGSSWTILFQHYEPGALVYLFSFIDSLNARIINPNDLAHVYKTNDGCVSFDTLNITNGPLVLQAKYDFKDLQYGYLYGTEGSMSHPTRTWNTGTFYFPIDLDGFGVLPVFDLDFNTSYVYASSLYGKIFYSQDFGNTWTEQITPANEPISSISFLNYNQGIAVSDMKVLYTTNGGFTGIHESHGINSLITLYPNPSTGELNVQNNTTRLLEFSIQNSLGEKVFDQVLCNRSNVLDISFLSGGIYFYKAITHTNKQVTGKIIKQ